MTTPLRKKQLAAKKQIKEQMKDKTESPVVEMPKKETTVPHPQMPKDQKEVEVTVIGNKLKVAKFDPMGYMVALDIFYIRDITRVSYNVLMGELILILPEVNGRIYEADMDIINPMGKKTGGKRRELTGQITMFKTNITEEATIRKFLTVWYEDTKLDDKTFEGFKHHKIAKDVIDKAMKAKQAEAEKGKSTILSPHTGQPVENNDK